jgi:hypothetical protein
MSKSPPPQPLQQQLLLPVDPSAYCCCCCHQQCQLHCSALLQQLLQYPLPQQQHLLLLLPLPPCSYRLHYHRCCSRLVCCHSCSQLPLPLLSQLLLLRGAALQPALRRCVLLSQQLHVLLPHRPY